MEGIQSDNSPAAKQEEDILVEKDGKFELVKVKDMQASTELELENPKQAAKTKEGGADMVSQGETVNSKNKSDTEEKSATKPTEINTSIKSESTVKFTVESTEPPPRVNTPTLTTNASTSLLTQASKPKPASSSRTKSAPGYRDRDQDEARQKKERSEAAFRAWLLKKDRQLSQQRQSELSKVKQTDEELREKQRQSEVAYKAWLECKKQEYLEQRAKEKVSRPVTSVSRDEEERKRAAFENWLSVKQKVKQKENESKQKLKEQEELSAKRADPTLASQSYKTCVYIYSVI